MIKSLILDRSKGPIDYPVWPLFLLAPLMAFVALAYVEKFSYKLALVTPAFYVAWLASTLIVGLLMYMVQWVTTRFDAHYPWHRVLANRLTKQTLGGLVLPVFMAFILAAFYFWANKSNIVNTIWFQSYLPLIIVLLAMLNLCYAFYGSLNEQYAPAPNQPANSIPEPVLLTEQQLPVVQKAKPAVLPAVAKCALAANSIPSEWLKIACIFCCQKRCYGVDLDGKSVAWTYSFGEAEALLQNNYFFAINRSYLINFEAIEDYNIKSTKVLLLKLRPAIEAKIIAIIQDVSWPQRAPQQPASAELAQLATQSLNKPFQLRVSYGRKISFLRASKEFNAMKKRAQAPLT
ncbi:MAG: LytTR family transcriptional regulator [Sphingobacteriales bacterium]|nr:MAG: LytTR family transcriptional regulator [Sphingobacteriales bacterium]